MDVRLTYTFRLSAHMFRGYVIPNVIVGVGTLSLHKGGTYSLQAYRTEAVQHNGSAFKLHRIEMQTVATGSIQPSNGTFVTSRIGKRRCMLQNVFLGVMK